LASLTVENYLKQIYLLSRSDAAVATGEIAPAMGVSPGTVTSMLKTLADAGLAVYTPYEGVRLTPAGLRLALRILRRHRLIELFLVRTLNLSWDEVHDEAEHMEHAMSDALIDRIDQYLGCPTVDPHGDPIPSADGAMPERSLRSLANCGVGEHLRLRQVVDQSPEFLRRLSESGLALDSTVSLVEVAADGDVTVRLQESFATAALTRAEAGKLLVE
jgi:DtxR family transcriptional regulator, Mn-dependent transcriptional regulator